MDTLTRDRREFLKDTIRRTVNFATTDQARGIPPPPMMKPPAKDAEFVELPAIDKLRGVRRVQLRDAIARRRSRRDFLDERMTLDEVSFLLWATQGVRETPGPATALRTVPSAGARHAFETYLCVRNVKSLQTGMYRYLPFGHRLVLEHKRVDPGAALVEGTLGQQWCRRAAVAFVWTVIPYRMEWRYGHAAHKVIALDAGHVAQNLYLACQAAGAGTCAIAAYDQERMDALLGVDGEDEFTIYLAPVGKVSQSQP